MSQLPRQSRRLVLLTALPVIVLLLPGTVYALDWNTTTVESEGDVGTYASITVDRYDRYLISYHDSGENTLKFAISEDYGETWTTSIVDDSDGDPGWWISIKVDSQNNYLIAYHNFNYTTLKFAKSEDNGQNWTIDTIWSDPTEYIGGGVSLAVDPSDNYIVSHTDYDGTDRLLFSKSTDYGQSWDNTIIESSNDIGTHTSIAAASENTYVISYSNDSAGQPLFTMTTDGGQNWSARRIVDNQAAYDGEINRIAVDHNGDYVMAYLDYTNSAIKISKSSNGVDWTTQSLSLTGAYRYSGDFTSLGLAIGQNGEYILSAYESDDSDLGFIISEDNGTTWSDEIVDDPVNSDSRTTGICNDIAVDSANSYLLAYYYSNTSHDLKFANTDREFQDFTCSVTLNPTSISAGESTSASVTITDPEFRQSYTYAWSDNPDIGTFANSSASSTTFTSDSDAQSGSTLSVLATREVDGSTARCSSVLGITGRVLPETSETPLPIWIVILTYVPLFSIAVAAVTRKLKSFIKKR